MIRTFADRDTPELYATGTSSHWARDIRKRGVRKLEYLGLAVRLADLRVPRGNRRHALSGGRKGQYSISINDQWRICFRVEDGDAYEVESCDYH